MPSNAQTVTYVEDGEHYALVVKDNGGGFLDLLVKLPHGWEVKKNVTRRDPPYDPGDNGNVTWHDS